MPAGEEERTTGQASPPGSDRPVVEEAAQVVGQVGRRSIAVGLPGVEALQADRAQILGDRGDQLFGRDDHGLAVPDEAERLQVVCSLDRWPPGQANIKNRPERVDVGDLVDGAVVGSRLLGRHVLQSAEKLVVLGQASRILLEPRHSEIGELGLLVVSQEDVGGLEVAVDDPCRVGRVDGRREGPEDLGDGPGLERSRVLEAFLEIAGKEFEDQVAWSVGGFVAPQNLDDVAAHLGRPERGQGLGLVRQPAALNHVLVEGRLEPLDRDEPGAGQVRGSIDLTELALTDDFVDQVTRDLGPVVGSRLEHFKKGGPAADVFFLVVIVRRRRSHDLFPHPTLPLSRISRNPGPARPACLSVKAADRGAIRKKKSRSTKVFLDRG